MAGEDYLAITQANAEEQRYWANQPPASCPIDGTVLLPGPASSPGILWCPFDGWEYPRDWVRPFAE